MTVLGFAARVTVRGIGTFTRGTVVGMVAAMLCATAPTGVAAQDAAASAVRLELNKTEAQPTGCRVYFVLDNGTAEAFDAFKLDLVVFAPDGVILRNLATEMGPLRPAKRVVKMFDLADQPCDGIGSLLVNDVLDCQSGGQPRNDCVDLLTVDSRAAVELVK